MMCLTYAAVQRFLMKMERSNADLNGHLATKFKSLSEEKLLYRGDALLTVSALLLPLLEASVVPALLAKADSHRDSHCYLKSSPLKQKSRKGTSVPAIPIARPISASCKAGASLVPSPVTATTSSNSCFRRVTSLCLSTEPATWVLSVPTLVDFYCGILVPLWLIHHLLICHILWLWPWQC